MTAYEAIKELSYDDTAYGGRCTKEVREVAIKALEVVQHLTGLINELEDMAKEYERVSDAHKNDPMSLGDYASGKKVGFKVSINLLKELLGEDICH